MKCPFCGVFDSHVVATRLSEEGSLIRRRRRCATCNKRFNTIETADARMPSVVKQTGERVEFEREKLRISFMRALHKRPVPTALVEDAIDALIQRLLRLGNREIKSREIGQMVMMALKKLDEVAYIRFSSVYCSFNGIEDFQNAIHEVSAEGKR